MNSTRLLTKVLGISQRPQLKFLSRTSINVIGCYSPIRTLHVTRCINREILNSNHPTAEDNTDRRPFPSKEAQKLKNIIDKSKLLTRLRKNPRFSRYFDKLLEASPIPTIASFFILHELTAIIPLFSVWYLLYNWNILGDINLSGDFITQCSDAIERLVGTRASEFADKHRLIISGALSYALVKILAPARILVSLWGAPYVARWMVIPFRNFRNMLRGKSNAK